MAASTEKSMPMVDVVEGTEGFDSKQKKDEGYHNPSEEKVEFSHYFRIFSYATKLDACMLLIGCAASIGAGVTLPLMNIVFGNLVGGFNTFSTSSSSESRESFRASLNKQTLYLVYLWIGKFVLCYLAMFTFRLTGLRISAALRLAYTRAVFSQCIGVLDTLPAGQVAATITTKANLLQLGISEKLSTGLQSIALLVGAYAIAFRYSWKLTLVTSSVLLFVLLVYSPMIPVTIKLQKNKDHADETSTSIASETLGSIRMVVACGAEDRVDLRYGGWVEESRRRGLKISPWLGLQLAPMFFSIYADFALTFWFGVRLYMQGDVSDVSTVLIVLMSVLLSVTSLGRIIAPVLDISKAAGAASSFFAMIDAPTHSTDCCSTTDISLAEDILLEDVTFAYPSRPHVKALDGLSMRIEAGKLTAIVGPSGSGKSTVIALLERWYELGATGNANACTMDDKPDEYTISRVDVPLVIEPSGSITIGQNDISQLNPKWWRSQISLVSQEPFIFNDSIFQNISHGLVGSRFEEADEATKRHLVQEACREANVDEFLERLPMGLDTIVGDGGIKLSGGQRQRICIARGIIKQPQILLLDEATSSIDVRGERRVQEALDRASKKRTTIIIAHRLSTIRKADRIFVMSKGKVVEHGSHDELLSKLDGTYFKLVSAQHVSSEAVESFEELTSGSNRLEVDILDAEDEKVREESQEPWNDRRRRGVFGGFGLMLIEQRAYFPWLVTVLLGTLATGVSMPLQSYLMAKAIVVFSLVGQALSNGSKHWSLLFFILALATGAAYFVVGWAACSLSVHISSSYRREYFSNIIRQPIAFFDEHSAGTLISRVSGDPQQLEQLMGLNMAFMLTAAFSIMGCVAIAFAFGWKLTVIALVSSLPVILIASWYRVRFELVFEKMNAAVFAESSKFAAEAIGAFRTVTSLTLEDLICKRYEALLDSHITGAMRKAWGSTLIFALSDSVNLLCMALTFWVGGHFLLSMDYSPLQFLIIYIAIIQGSESAGQWMSFGPNVAAAIAASNRILEFRRKKVLKQAHALALSPVKGSAKIEFRDVHFKYPTRDIPIFHSLSFTIEAGQFAAFVGASGCGKTTIISLLEQFYTIQKGAIFLDGVDITRLDVAEYRHVFSLVAQESGLQSGTIRENVLLGVDKKKIGEEDLHQACHDAEIHNFITSLPEGYDTDIGSRGVALSGGQKQRISIARALVRKPRVLLLDEATSNLDTESEKLVQASFERAGKGRTIISIAHRISTVSNADVIFVLGNTRDGQGASILEKGTHQELLGVRGIYWQMCESQALDR